MLAHCCVSRFKGSLLMCLQTLHWRCMDTGIAHSQQIGEWLVFCNHPWVCLEAVAFVSFVFQFWYAKERASLSRRRESRIKIFPSIIFGDQGNGSYNNTIILFFCQTSRAHARNFRQCLIVDYVSTEPRLDPDIALPHQAVCLSLSRSVIRGEGLIDRSLALRV